MTTAAIRVQALRRSYGQGERAFEAVRGVDLDVAWPGGGTLRCTGNSFATPHIAGIAARILSKHPGLTPYQVKAVLQAVSDNADTRHGRCRAV